MSKKKTKRTSGGTPEMSTESKNDVVGVASHALLVPFVAVAKGIPDNWPGECILRFDQRNVPCLSKSHPLILRIAW